MKILIMQRFFFFTSLLVEWSGRASAKPCTLLTLYCSVCASLLTCCRVCVHSEQWVGNRQRWLFGTAVSRGGCSSGPAGHWCEYTVDSLHKCLNFISMSETMAGVSQLKRLQREIVTTRLCLILSFLCFPSTLLRFCLFGVIRQLKWTLKEPFKVFINLVFPTVFFIFRSICNC